MIVKFNPSGTHIKNGLLKVRLDIYPAPTDKTYVQQFVGGVLNPCLCHFLIIDSSLSVAGLTGQIQSLFDSVTLTTLDDALSLDDRVKVSQTMRTKLGAGSTVRGNLTKLINDTNTKLNGLEVEV